jgi:hypothetical protein
MIGLCGAHRTGKTSLAQAFSNHSGVPFLQTSASAIFSMMGYDPKADYPIDIRLHIQRELLIYLRGTYDKWKGQTFITDRTPLDLAAYLLADVTRENVCDGIVEYVEDCLELTNRTFGTIFIIQPGIPLVEEQGKAPATPAYIEHLNALIVGLSVDPRLAITKYRLPRSVTDMLDRVGYIDASLRHLLVGVQKTLNDAREFGHSAIIH